MSNIKQKPNQRLKRIIKESINEYICINEVFDTNYLEENINLCETNDYTVVTGLNQQLKDCGCATTLGYNQGKHVLQVSKDHLSLAIDTLKNTCDELGYRLGQRLEEKHMKQSEADKKYKNGTTYKDSSGRTHKRVAYPGTAKGNAYCGRTVSQKRTPKVKTRRKAWGCSGKRSVKKS